MGTLNALPWWSWPAVFVPLFLLYRRTLSDNTSGRVVGIVGRMGSGKSYFAMRMAYSRMAATMRDLLKFAVFILFALWLYQFGVGVIRK